MKILLLAILLFTSTVLNAQTANPSDEKLEFDLKQIAENFVDLKLEVLPIKDKGRLKPLDTLARENNIYHSQDFSHNHTAESPEYGTLPWRSEEVSGHVVTTQMIYLQLLAIQELLDVEVLDVDMASAGTG